MIHAGLLDFLSPAAAKASPQAEGLVDELLEIASRTNGGSKASSDTRETIDGLVRAAPCLCNCLHMQCQLSGSTVLLVGRAATALQATRPHPEPPVYWRLQGGRNTCALSLSLSCMHLHRTFLE